MEQVSEFRVKIQIRNNRLIKAREELGLSAKAASEQSGVAYHSILDLEGMRISPINGLTRDWRESASRLAEYYGYSTEFLWPEAVRQLRCSSAERELSRADIGALLASEPPLLPAPDQLYEQRELNELITQNLETLTPREQLVIEARFGLNGKKEHNLDEAGVVVGGISRERVRQIEAKALKKLRHPSRAVRLRSYLSQDDLKADPCTSSDDSDYLARETGAKRDKWNSASVLFVPVEARHTWVSNGVWCRAAPPWMVEAALRKENKTFKEASTLSMSDGTVLRMTPVLIAHDAPEQVLAMAQQYLSVNMWR